MALKSVVAIAAAAALAAAPALAAPRSAAPVTIGPAAEKVEGSDFRRSGILIPLIGVAIIVLALLYFTKKDRRVSP
jgi:di/tricarboxylate transporter